MDGLWGYAGHPWEADGSFLTLLRHSAADSLSLTSPAHYINPPKCYSGGESRAFALAVLSAVKPFPQISAWLTPLPLTFGLLLKCHLHNKAFWYGLNCVPLKDVEVLIPSACEYDLILK